MKIQDEGRIIEKNHPADSKTTENQLMKNFATSRGHAKTLMSVQESSLAILTSAKKGQKLPIFSPCGKQIPIITPSNESEMSSSFGAWRSEKGITINQGHKNRKGAHGQ